MDALTAAIGSSTRQVGAIGILAVVSLLVALGAGESAPVGATLAVVGIACSFVFPIGVAAFTLAVVPFAFELHPLPGGGYSLLELGLAWTVAGVGLRFLTRPRQLLRRVGAAATRYPWITVAAGTLLIATLVSVLALPEDAHRSEALREVRRVVVEPIAFVAVLLLLDLRQRERTWLVTGLLTGGVVSSMVALSQLFDADAGVIADSVTRLTGPYSHPNNLALYLERIAALAVPAAILISGRLRMALIGSLALMSLALALTFSRGGWLGFAAAVAVMLLVLQRYRWLIWMAVAGLLAAIPGAIFLRERILDLGGASDEPTRFAIWRSTRAMILDSPWTGVGPDQFLYQYGRRYVEPIGWPERYTSHPHNLVLDFAVRLGVGGFAALASMVAAAVAGAISGLKAIRTDTVRLGSLGALVAGFVHGLIDNSYFLPDLSVLFWTCLLLLWLDPASSDEAEMRL
ncbi:MAG TPA: O-antigen ligase family protein [Thermomicrobiales bacterium]|nr:O-antigen ligase family protein [Thermomicrobiales bacterium]